MADAAPTVTTGGISAMSPTQANATGTITNTGGQQITARGIFYDTTPGLGQGSQGVTENPLTSSTTGSFTLTLGAHTLGLALVPDTLYYYRAFAENIAGLGLGAELTFTTPKISAGRKFRLLSRRRDGFRLL